ncbi:coiled-coil domain-containing protein 152 [Sinocyclocheilus grahami]|uniref:Coiled-coil domain containing 152 n=1 Tax=Sinocyclocheilus grahami TaxID=75366 RepID=A0A672RWQ9_SINGR|nr:PREDICTED: coiled-coil domain-containing protein 152 [Sinocyclocheilus grahami]XP_016133170.1 PREDICTED: coiled-coil domain-containing protein 152 [Sinocyclocheilus grahami]XP_016133171.1 PREDICTED: coiled-coil domain-containing protein 152 [Sinocyclocheilus grahami]
MKKLTAVDLSKLVKDFIQLEHKITEMKGENNTLEIQLDETSRLLKIAQNKEKQLIEERDGLLETVKGLQQTLHQQCDLRVENERLKNAALQMKKENEDQLKESNTLLQRMAAEMKALQDQHQRELEDCDKEKQRKLDAKDTELKVTRERNECALEELRRQMREKEKEMQSQIIKLQMEFGAKLARAQSMSTKSQPQTQASAPHPQNIFKRKLQFIQEEKNKEIEVLRQRVRELEQQSLQGLMDSRLKRRKN